MAWEAAIIGAYWIVIRLSERFFTNSAEANSSFAASTNHFYNLIVFSSMFAMLFLAGLRTNLRFKLSYSPYISAQFLLILYAAITASWSDMALVSAGQALYSFYWMFFSIFIGKYCLKAQSPIEALGRIIRIWSFLIFIDYFIAIVYFYNTQGTMFPPIDERALVAAALLAINVSIGRNIKFGNALLAYIFLFGKSLSAVLSSLFLVAGFVRSKFGNVFAISLVVLLVPTVNYIASLVQQDEMTIYGKNWAYMLTGSGRYDVWINLWDGIWYGSFFDLIFGHGYVSERAYLTTISDLTWTIDAHNNILQSLYGVGLIGTLIMLYIWLLPHLRYKQLYAAFGAKTGFLILSANTAFIFFGLTSSYYFSKPSVSACVFSSIMIVALNAAKFWPSGRQP